MSLTKEITNYLFDRFEAHKYMLSNSYVYVWESDFFSQLTSGYHQEIEVKISRSDFFADFKKENKHKTLLQKFNGAKIACHRIGTVYKVKVEKESTVKDKTGRGVRGEHGRFLQEKTGEIIIRKTMLESKLRNEVSRKPDNSSIQFKDCHCPNRFYYCCPTGLIKPEEVPEYAGLMYYEDNKITKVKNAPLIHKEKRNLSQVLLDKFYHKYLYSR